MPFNAKTTASRQALPKPEILATPLETNIIESGVLAAAATSADGSGPYTGRRYLLAGTVLAKRDDGKYIPYLAGASEFAEVAKVILTGTGLGGTFKLTFEGQQTGTIAYNASTTVLKEKLEALTNIGESEVAVTGTPGAWTVTFAGTLAKKNLAEMTIDAASVTGTVTEADVVTTTEGGQKIAGILFDTVEFADATVASDEPAAFLRRNVQFDQNSIVNWETLKTDLLAWAKETNCEFVNVTNAQEA